jgi:pilus assembly protein FimV
MPRRLNGISALALALLPALAGALGLGGIRGDSALNEPFLARIELNGVAPEELDGVKVILASEAEFTKAGSPRSDFLTGLIFVPEVSPEGKVQVRVTSTKPIREPYLDFLVEVTWPKGRLVKGYTVLLDPPTTLNRPAPRVAPPKAMAPGTASAPPAAAPLARTNPSVGSPAPTAQTPGSASQTPASPRPGSPDPASVPAPVPTLPPHAGYPLRYGPVPAGGNLTSVARRMAPEGASQAQTALAIYRANPQAFGGGNVNKIKAGARLEIPHPHLIFAFDAETAKQQYLAAQRGQPLPPLPAIPHGEAPGPGLEPIRDRLEIATREPELAGTGQATAQAPASPTSQTPAVTPLPATPGASLPAALAPELALVEREMLLVREMAESGRQETADLRGRISRLEDHLSDIKRLLELSNAQLAQLQGAGARGEPAGNIGRLETEPGERGERMSAPGPEPVRPAPVESQPEPPAKPELAVKTSPPPRLVQEPPPPESSFLDDVSSWALVAGGPLLILLLGLLFLVRRQNQTKEAAELAELDLADSPPAEVAVPAPAELQPNSLSARITQVCEWAAQAARKSKTPEALPPRTQAADLAEVALAESLPASAREPALLESKPNRLLAMITKVREWAAQAVRKPKSPEASPPSFASLLKPGPEEAIPGSPAVMPAVPSPLRGPPLAPDPKPSPPPVEVAAPGVAAVRPLEEAHDSQPLAPESLAVAAATIGEVSAGGEEQAEVALAPTSGMTPATPSPGMDSLDLDVPLEVALEAATKASPSAPAKLSEEPYELDLSDLEGWDLGMSLTPNPPAPAPTPAAPQEPLDLVTPALGNLVLAPQASSPEPEPVLDLTAGDFDLDLESLGKRGSAEGDQHREPLIDLDLDLDDLMDLDLSAFASADHRAESPPAVPAANLALDWEALGLELEQEEAAPEELSKGKDVSDTDFPADFPMDVAPWDEVGIKLDLARAYLQMDDPEAARAILVEAIAEGTGDQIAEAKTMLARLE